MTSAAPTATTKGKPTEVRPPPGLSKAQLRLLELQKADEEERALVAGVHPEDPRLPKRSLLSYGDRLAGNARDWWKTISAGTKPTKPESLPRGMSSEEMYKLMNAGYIAREALRAAKNKGKPVKSG